MVRPVFRPLGTDWAKIKETIVMTNYAYSFRDAKGITFEAESDPNSTVRFSRTISPKTVDGLKLVNVRSDVVVLRQADPRGPECTDCTSVLEPLSVRLITSGSRDNTAVTEKMLATLLNTVWANRSVLLNGSLPNSETAIVVDPVLTVTAA